MPPAFDVMGHLAKKRKLSPPPPLLSGPTALCRHILLALRDQDC